MENQRLIWQGEQLISEGERFVREGNVSKAIANYEEAQTIAPNLKISADSWHKLCWYGSLWGHAIEVMDACERAVELAPNRGNVRTSRGLARALTGDHFGAIKDLKFAAQWNARVEKWVTELETGQNPFDEATLERLRNE